MTPNLPTLDDIAGGAPLAGLSLDALDALLCKAEAQNKTISAAKRAITGYIESAYQAHITAAYDAKGADFGSVRIGDDGYEIVIDTPKKVEWDSAKLAAIRAAIADSGDNPAEYLKETLSVDERAYAAWPSHIRATFAEARMVKPGSRTVKLLRKEAA